MREEVEELAGSRAKLKAQLGENDSTIAEYNRMLQQQREEISMLEVALEGKRENKWDRQVQYEGTIQVKSIKRGLLSFEITLCF